MLPELTCKPTNTGWWRMWLPPNSRAGYPVYVTVNPDGSAVWGWYPGDDPEVIDPEARWEAVSPHETEVSG